MLLLLFVVRRLSFVVSWLFLCCVVLGWALCCCWWLVLFRCLFLVVFCFVAFAVPWVPLGRLLGHLVGSWELLGSLGVPLGTSRNLLEPLGDRLGTSWVPLGRLLWHLGEVLEGLGASWGGLGES